MRVKGKLSKRDSQKLMPFLTYHQSVLVVSLCLQVDQRNLMDWEDLSFGYKEERLMNGP